MSGIENLHEDKTNVITGTDDETSILGIINSAANVYRGVIPDDRWHEPYMNGDELSSELRSGVEFTGLHQDNRLVGVMGAQTVKNVRLIRHAYVLPECQGQGIGSRLISHICKGEFRPILVGTWRAATWAIGFYERHGFRLVQEGMIAPLLKTYWQVPEEQIEASVVLVSPNLRAGKLKHLIANAEPAAT